MITRRPFTVVRGTYTRVSIQSHYHHRRPLSTSTASFNSHPRSPSPRICSVPFSQTPQDVLPRLHIGGLMSTGWLPNVLYAGLLKVFGEVPGVQWLASLFSMGQSLQMKEMKAVLYPTWRCDVVLQGKARAAGDQANHEMDGILACEKVYLPGNSFAPLSYASFAMTDMPLAPPEYDPSRDLKQLGDDFEIVPVPFTTSPLTVLRRLRKIIGHQEDWEGISFDATKWKETMVACYPVMMPLYIAEFEFTKQDSRSRAYSVVLEAHNENLSECRLIAPVIPEMLELALAKGRQTNYFSRPVQFMEDCDFIFHEWRSNRKNPPQHNHNYANPGDVMMAYHGWISPQPESRSLIPPSPLVEIERQEGTDIDWDDVRIQRYDDEVQAENATYLQKLVKREQLLPKLNHMESVPGQHKDMVILATEIDENGKTTIKKQSFAEALAETREGLKELEKELKTAKPEWLTKWEKANGRGSMSTTPTSEMATKQTIGSGDDEGGEKLDAEKLTKRLGQDPEAKSPSTSTSSSTSTTKKPSPPTIPPTKTKL